MLVGVGAGEVEMTVWRRDPDSATAQVATEADAFAPQNLFELALLPGESFEVSIPGVVTADGYPATATGAKLLTNGVLGADLLVIPAHARFPLHVHPGHHLLLCLVGAGTFTLGGVTHPVKPGDLYMVEGSVPHAVGAGTSTHVLVSFGSPHVALDSPYRMQAIVNVEDRPETMERIREYLASEGISVLTAEETGQSSQVRRV